MTTPSPAASRVDSEWLPLLREALSQGERFRWPLSGTSMLPTLPPGCRIEIGPLPTATRAGDVIVFSSDGQLVAHRLVRRTGGTWITQGDGRLGPDRPLASSQVLGAVVAAYDEDGQRCWPRRFRRVEAFKWLARFQALRGPRYLRGRLRQLFSVSKPD